MPSSNLPCLFVLSITQSWLVEMGTGVGVGVGTGLLVIATGALKLIAGVWNLPAGGLVLVHSWQVVSSAVIWARLTAVSGWRLTILNHR